MKQGSHGACANLMHSIYVIEGVGGYYVGCTSREVEYRFRQHVSAAQHGSNLPLHRAMREHGESAFRISVVAQARGLENGRAVERLVTMRFVKSGQALYNADRDTLFQARLRADVLAYKAEQGAA